LLAYKLKFAQVVLNFGLHRSTTLRPNFAPLFERRRHSMAHCRRMVRGSAMVTMENLTYRKPSSLFRMVPSLTAYDFPFPQNGAPKHRQKSGPTSRRVLPPGQCDKGYRQRSCVLCRVTSHFAKLLWSLFQQLAH